MAHVGVVFSPQMRDRLAIENIDALEADTLLEALGFVWRQCPVLREQVLRTPTHVSDFVGLYVGEKRVDTEQGDPWSLSDGDVIRFLLPVSGG